MWTRLRRTDKTLILLLMPLWFVAFVLHFELASTDTLRLMPVFLQTSPEADGYPRVAELLESSREEIELSGMRVGAVVRAIDGHDLAGTSGFVASLQAFAALKPDHAVMATIVDPTSQRTMQVEWPYLEFPLPWWWPSLFGASFGLAGLLILLSAPASRTAQAVFPAFLLFALTWLLFPGRSITQTLAGLVVYLIAMVFSGPLILRAVMLLPDRTAIQSRIARRSVWLFSLMALAAFSAFTGLLVPASTGQMLHLSGITLFYAAILVILARNYIRADALGRRQLRWVLLGFYLAFVPALLVTLSGILFPERFTLYTLASIGMPLIPLAFLIAIARYNLFDIDRVIGGTVSYSILVVIIAVVTEAIIEPLVAGGGSAFGLEGDTVQVAFVALLTAGLVPVQRRWRPFVDRMFFAEGVAVDAAVETLIAGLEQRRDEESLTWLSMGATGIAEIYGVGSWVVLARGDAAPAVACAHGDQPPGIDAGFWQLCEKRLRPGIETTASGTAVLVVPLRPWGRLDWVMLFTRKSNGDVYTATDVGLIAQVSQVVSGGIAACVTPASALPA